MQNIKTKIKTQEIDLNTNYKINLKTWENIKRPLKIRNQRWENTRSRFKEIWDEKWIELVDIMWSKEIVLNIMNWFKKLHTKYKD